MKRDFARAMYGLALLTACTSRPVELDDEAGTTTAMSESTSDSETTSTTDDESTSSDASDAGDDEVSVTFIVEFDVPPASECDMYMQDCPPGEKCVPYASDGNEWNASKCVPVMGDQQPGEPCSWGGIVEATDDCDATSVCWDVMDVDGELVGTCVAFCQGTPDRPECPPGSSCLICGSCWIPICIQHCDPLVQDCAEGLGCFWANTGFNCIFTAGDIPTGEPCGYVNDCAPGNFCADAASLPSCNGAACCTAYCDLQLGDAGCAAQPDTVCVSFFEEGMAPPGYENVGLCVLPP
jgi:hypothetical protein